MFKRKKGLKVQKTCQQIVDEIVAYYNEQKERKKVTQLERTIPRRNKSINSALAILGVKDWRVYAEDGKAVKFGTIYERLGGEEEVLRIARAAYREKIFEWHPDRNPEYTRDFCDKYSQAVTEAYQFVQKVIKYRIGGR